MRSEQNKQHNVRFAIPKSDSPKANVDGRTGDSVKRAPSKRRVRCAEKEFYPIDGGLTLNATARIKESESENPYSDDDGEKVILVGGPSSKRWIH